MKSHKTWEIIDLQFDRDKYEDVNSGRHFGSCLGRQTNCLELNHVIFSIVSEQKAIVSENIWGNYTSGPPPNVCH